MSEDGGPADPLAELIAQAKEAWEHMTPAERKAMYQAQRDSYVRAEAAFGSDADEAEYAEALRSGDPERIAEVKRKEAERVAAADAFIAARESTHD